MSVIRVTIATVVTGLVAVTLAACGSATTPGGGGAAPSSSSAPAPPTTVPPATGPVTGVGTVIEVPEKGPELCLGPVRESFPPQCEGVPLARWDWAKAGIQEESPAGTGTAVRWGTYAVTGTFDGLTMTVTTSVSLALYDTVAPPSPRPMAPPELTADEWADVETGVRLLPGLLTSLREGDTGPVLVDVVHDDGTLQDWADAAFGVGAVRVTSMLR
ncbi:hypothetical protein [Oryzobacter terrae]|uniref:hypothetical protein n=1 Tax=Oryzobacter terrae TaxID=1620385 RepID=UPI00366C0FA9